MTRLQTLLFASLCIALGASVAVNFTQGAQAQGRQFQECYMMKTWVANGGQMASKMARIPPGFTPVGGGGTGKTGALVLCR